jgi:hypothetical protein
MLKIRLMISANYTYKEMAMRSLLVLSLIFGLSGCLSMDSITPSPKAPRDTSYYLIDTQFRLFCQGNTKRCADMTKIVSSRAQLRPIEATYNTTVKGPNYPVSLMRMLMNPADKSYSSNPVGKDGRYYKIPSNDKTDVAWETLIGIQDNLFSSGS